MPMHMPVMKPLAVTRMKNVTDDTRLMLQIKICTCCDAVCPGPCNTEYENDGDGRCVIRHDLRRRLATMMMMMMLMLMLMLLLLLLLLMMMMMMMMDDDDDDEDDDEDDHDDDHDDIHDDHDDG